MKKWSILFGAVVAVGGSALLIHGFIRDDPIDYFSDQPRLLFLVIGIALGVGFAALGFYRLPTPWRDRLSVFCLGACAVILSLLVGYGMYQFIRWPTLPSSSELLIPLLVGGSGAALLWFEFYRKLRKWLL